MRKPEEMRIYNIFPPLAGKFTEWGSHLERAAGMGFNWIFVNPIQRPGASGSLYSIADYFDFNPRFVDEKSQMRPVEQVGEVIAKAEKLGLNVMIDLVINHCAVDSELLRSHPNWFEWDSPGNVAHPWANEDGRKVVWGDLARFNYAPRKELDEMYQYFLKLVKNLLERGFKGFRCDAAYQVPNSIWERLIGEVRKASPSVRFLAETLGCTPDQTKATASSGFDYIFNSSKWWDFRSPWLMEQYDLTRQTVPSISFPESHDTVRLCEELGGNVNGLKQRYLFESLFSAGILIPIGFEFGFRKRLHVINTRPQDWETTGIDLRDYISKVNKLKASNAILQEDGPAQIVPHENQNIFILWKGSSSLKKELLLILNKDIYNGQHFQVGDIYSLLKGGKAPLADVSPENAMNSIPASISYDLRPGQGIVLITK